MIENAILQNIPALRFRSNIALSRISYSTNTMCSGYGWLGKGYIFYHFEGEFWEVIQFEGRSLSDFIIILNITLCILTYSKEKQVEN